MAHSMKMPTIQDVARTAGVSAATVSRALSDPERVALDTRARIFHAVQSTGYTLNQSARSLRLKTARTILVGLPDIGNPFFSTILDAIEREAARRGYGVLVANRFVGANAGQRLRDYFSSNRADGLLLLDGSLPLAHLQALKTVPVIVACETIVDSTLHSVRTDNVYAARTATAHLIGLGHRRIGHISGPAGNVLSAERETGFRLAMSSAGLSVDPALIYQGDFSMERGAVVAEAWLGTADRPSAIFAANDETAIGFIAGIARHGLQCPRDVSVVGFDDLGLAGHYLPPLTTMRQPREALGRLAAGALIDLIEASPYRNVPTSQVLSSELIVRASSAAPALSLVAI